MEKNHSHACVCGDEILLAYSRPMMPGLEYNIRVMFILEYKRVLKSRPERCNITDLLVSFAFHHVTDI